MSLRTLMAELKRLGTAQNRKVYARHGAREPLFGVSYADLGKLRKRIKTDHRLALDLWTTGNHDARVLATMIADPALLDDRTVEAWGKDLDNYVLTDAFTALVARSRLAERKMLKWTRSRQEWLGSAGWGLVSYLRRDGHPPDEDICRALLERLEAEIHGSKNRVRHSMNGALISIGMMSPAFEKLAVAAAKRIGPVEVDHGETGCKTPEAVAYIAKAKARQRRRPVSPA